jgi:hypothetical protein
MAEPRAPELEALADVARKAALGGYCTKLFCTTCGGMQVRTEIRAIGGRYARYGGPLVRALTDEPPYLASLPRFHEIGFLAFIALPFKTQQDEVLEAWLPHAREDLFFLDVVLMFFVRHYPHTDSLRQRWVELGFERAVQTGDDSLVETMIALERAAVLERPAFMAVAGALAEDSTCVARAFRRARIALGKASTA